MALNFEDWNRWRDRISDQVDSLDEAIGDHASDIAVLKATLQIVRDNQAARHSQTPAVIFGIIAAASTLVTLTIQLLAAKGSIP